MGTLTRSGANYYDVYLGFWTNWAHGRVQGSTLTLSRENGNLLIAFLAIFVGATGKSFWRIGCLLLHRYFSSSGFGYQDGLHHQRQIILRNAETPGNALLHLPLVLSAWRGKAQRVVLRLLPVILFAILTASAFTVAGLFSSRVTTETASEVLLKGGGCRQLSAGDEADWLDWTAATETWGQERIHAHLAYARQCYTAAENNEDCRQYVKPNIPFNVTREAACPFDDKMCKSKSIIVDTGLLNSNHDLGINTPKNLQFDIRIINQCVPLVSEGYTSESTVGGNFSDSDVPVTLFHYGNFTNGLGNVTDYVYLISHNYSLPYIRHGDVYDSAPRADYRLGVRLARKGDMEDVNGTLLTGLIPELTRNDADVSLLFLSAPGVEYSKQIDDPWFSAHQKGSKIAYFSGESTLQLYTQDEPVSVMGCAAQMQLCNPNLPRDIGCQPLDSPTNTVLNGAGAPWANASDEVKEFLEWNVNTVMTQYNSIENIVWTGNGNALAARFGQGIFAHPVPDNQWQEEVIGWASASIASLQGAFVETSRGLIGLPLNTTKGPDNNGAKLACGSQRIMTARFSSFSVLGIALILTVGGLMLIIEATLEGLLDWIQRKNSNHDYARMEWKSNEVLQLHRQVHESNYSGTWSRATHTVPVTVADQKLSNLNISDMNHPTYVGTRGNERDWRQSSLPSMVDSETELKSSIRVRTEHVQRTQTESSLGTPVRSPLSARSWYNKGA